MLRFIFLPIKLVLLIGETQVVEAQNTGHGIIYQTNLDTDFYAVVVHFFSLGKPLFMGLELWQCGGRSCLRGCTFNLATHYFN